MWIRIRGPGGHAPRLVRVLQASVHDDAIACPLRVDRRRARATVRDVWRARGENVVTRRDPTRLGPDRERPRGMTTTRTRTVAYLRVSTDKQADHGVSLDAQRVKVQAYADLFELDLVAVEVDAGESAKSLARPALTRALGMLRRGAADAILVVKLDRLTRSVRDLCDLVDTYFRDGRYALLSVGEQIDTRSASGRMVLSMLTVIGQWEREAIGERTSAAMQHMISERRYTGGVVRYGYRVGDDGESLVEIAHEQAVLVEARALRAAGLSLRAVASTLGERGLVARNGRAFGPTQIANMVGHAATTATTIAA